MMPFMVWYPLGFKNPSVMKITRKIGYTGGTFLNRAQSFCRKVVEEVFSVTVEAVI
jgi:hypothetical protein